MQRQERNIAIEIVRGAFAAVWLPFTWAAGAPGAVLSLIRRSRQSSGEIARRGRFDTGKWTLELLKQLEWRRFEELCTAYFEALGTASGSLVLHCKAWSAYPIGIKSVRELRGEMAAAKVGQGVLVTSGRFSREAASLAAKESIELIDGVGFLEKLSAMAPEKALALLKLATKGDFLTPTCPLCSIKMSARKSTGEGRTFWGCQNYPRCKQTFSSTVND